MDACDAILHDTPIGALGFCVQGDALTRIHFLGPHPTGIEDRHREHPIIREAIDQIQAYLAGRRQAFDLPLAPEGTTFQRRVWAQLQTIPWGRTCSYKDVALALDQPGAMRAVGMACNRNPLPLVIPCHRVIGGNGQLVGFGGGLALKQQLLELEQPQLGLSLEG
ncbi:MAG: methylated-DNA-protein-cysteine S-methyltransferase [Puniceicoccaceae bacterium 5H]|nr:MAG: methylated-DNA-protein-cysteine S-methyltransferase [Puniceicoccaceae bacterium 5H]